MKLIRKRYYRYLFYLMFLSCFLIVAVLFWAIWQSRYISADQTYKQIYNLKKNFLKENVQNMIRDIDRLRAMNRAHADKYLNHLSGELVELYAISPSGFNKAALDLLNNYEYSEKLNIRFEDTVKGSTLFMCGHSSLPHELNFGSLNIKMGVNEEWVNRETRKITAEIIHSQKFDDDGYIWINEIINWNGGDNYAIRRVHPNLIKTEGSFLSTKTKDIKGNTPYLTELKGVREYGELYSTYFFKRKDNDKILEKLTYATLYRDYNWIIAMGTYLEDVQVYIDAAQKGAEIIELKIIIAVSVFFIFLFIVGLFIFSRIEKWYMFRSTLVIREESNMDVLTGAFNRRMCDMYIANSFMRYQRGLEDPVLFFFDIDNFKKINDTYGHEAGDKVLKAVTDQIRFNIRSTDRLFRWGGEEFLLMCYGISIDMACDLAGKFNNVISHTPIVIEIKDDMLVASDYIIKVTISIGVTFFSDSDDSPDSALKRVDIAMYKAKREGKNCARIL